MRACALLLALAVTAHAAAQEALVLGAEIALHGVHVRGFAPEGQRSAGRRIQSRRSARIAVFPGHVEHSAGETHTTIRVCGLDAVRSEVSFRATASSRVQIRDDEPSAHLVVPARPARTYVRVEILRAVEGRDRVVTVEWSVVSARREALRATEDAFFASIRCDDAP